MEPQQHALGVEVLRNDGDPSESRLACIGDIVGAKQ